MRYLVLFLSIPVLANSPADREQFLTTVHFAIRETDPALLERAQHTVLDQFSHTLSSSASLSNRGYQVRTAGNEVILTLISNEDLRDPMRVAVSSMINQLDGKIHTRGRARFYRTANSQPEGGVLDVVTDDSHTKILTINAQSVPLRDLLKELKSQVGNFSYLIPGECGERFVDWSFGDSASHPKSVDLALEELSTLFGLKLAKQNGTYIFSGSCPLTPARSDSRAEPALFPPQSAKAHLYFPIPLSD